MNALNAIPILGWLIAAVLCVFMAVPVWLLWNWLVPVYAYWLPEVYQQLPFAHVVGLLWLVSSLRSLLLPSISATATNKKDA